LSVDTELMQSQDLDPRPPEYEADLTIPPARCSISQYTEAQL
jgi:hypothetical protein